MVTEIRVIAEAVRAYGGVDPANVGISVSTPLALHLLAARIESEMRGLAVVDKSISRSFAPAVGGELIEFPDLRSVASVVTPHPVGVDVQVAELRATAARLKAVVADLRRALTSKSARKIGILLEAEASAIATFADAIA